MNNILGDRRKGITLDEALRNTEEAMKWAEEEEKRGAEMQRLEEQKNKEKSANPAEAPDAEEPKLPASCHGKIIQEIEGRIGRDGELYYYSIGERSESRREEKDTRVFTIANAAMALYFRVTGNQAKAERIVEEIGSCIGTYRGMYKCSLDSSTVWTISNAMMAIYFSVAGKQEEAKGIVSNIEAKVEKEGSLYKAGPKQIGVWTADNAAMALYYSIAGDKTSAKGIATEIGSKIKKDEKLYCWGRDLGNVMTECNALMALYFNSIGDDASFKRILSAIDARMPKNGMLYQKCAGERQCNTIDNALMALCLVVEEESQKLVKRLKKKGEEIKKYVSSPVLG